MTTDYDDLIFARRGDVALHGDLYRPNGPGPHPVVVAAPGGAWRRGHRRDIARWGDYFSARGVAFFAVDYRRAATGKAFPEAAHDILAAVRYVRGAAREYGLAPDRIGLLGASAGAQLAALVALAGKAPWLAEADRDDRYATIDPSVQCLAGIYGVYDLFAHWQECLGDNAGGDSPASRYLGVAPYDDQQIYFDASPLRHVTYSANRLPVFLAWGDADEAVWPSQSEAFVAALRQAHFRVRTCILRGAGHFWFGEEPIDDPQSFNNFLAPRLFRFIARELDVVSTEGF
jgi:acetyl esterase/lipase